MPFIAGRPLSQAAHELNANQALQIFFDVAEALAHAHRQGVIHRDIKPDNILITEDNRAVVIDWGLADAGQPRQVCGSPYYAAPEQLEGQVADQRADVYSLGVVLYFMLARQLPFARMVRDFLAFRRERGGISLIPLSVRRPQLPRHLSKVRSRAMAFQPAGRYTQIDDMIADMQSCLSRQLLPPRRPWLWYLWRWEC